MSKSRLFSGKIKKLHGDKLTVDRYDYLDPSQAEPDLGIPSVDGAVLVGSTSSNVRQWSPVLSLGTQTVVVISTVSNRFSDQPQALDVKGGAIVRGNLHVGGTAYLNDAEILTTQSGLTSVLGNSIINQVLLVNTSTNSVSTNTGALQVLGGVGIGGDLWVGGTAYLNSAQILTTATVDNYASKTTIFAGTDTAVNTSTGLVTIWNTSTLQTVTNRGSSTTNALFIVNDTETTSTTTGALIVTGGVGIGQSLRVGKNLYVDGTAYLNNAEVLTTASRITSLEGLTQVTQDFLINTTTNSISVSTGALQVRGGAGFVKDVRIGQNLYVSGSVFLGDAQVLTTETGISSVLGRTVVTQDFFVNTTTNSISTETGAIITQGGIGIGQDVYIGGKVVVQSTLGNTSTLANNALYVAGGVGIGQSLIVDGPAYFRNTVVFSGTSTNISSTNTFYTDNLINIHVPQGSFTGTDHTWTVDDGRDVGFVYHYYKDQDKDGFLGLANDSGYLEWYSDGLESDGIFTGTEYGVFKTGGIILTSTTASASTTTGALIVAGGAAVGKDLWVGGAIHAAGSQVLTLNDLETITYPASYITNDPTSVAGLTTLAGTSTSYGTYNFGSITDIQTFNDYNTGTNTGFYSINDASGAPGYVVYIGFTDIVEFNRVVLNVNYTQSSGHTVDIDLYNYVTSGWDTFTVYSGSPGWIQFALGLIDSAPYLSSGKVTLRIYHVSNGNTAHRTWIDYVAVEKSVQGGQGPRGSTGATGSTGAQGLTTSTTSTFIFFNTTTATSTISAAVVAYGGVGIGGGLYVRGDINYSGNIYQNGQLIGAVGYTGSAGYSGSQGTTGFTGSAGADGTTGTTGYTGSLGAIGYTGSKGDKGDAGAAGTGGTNGTPGYTGSVGYTGSLGYAGSKGDMGYTGPIGYTGSGGYNGSKGDLGYTGSKGEKGDSGTGGAGGTVLERHYKKPGVLTVNPGTEKWYVPLNSTITSIRARVEVAPVGTQGVGVRINVNSNSTATLTINTSTTVSSLNTSTINVNANDFITVDVINIGNINAGSDLTVTFTYIRNI